MNLDFTVFLVKYVLLEDCVLCYHTFSTVRVKIQCVKFLFRLVKREAVAMCKRMIHPDVKIKHIQYDSLQDFSIYTSKQQADLFKVEEYTTWYYIVLLTCFCGKSQ